MVMTPELAAQKALIAGLHAELNLMKSPRARKSKAYRDLEQRIREESDRFNAMLVALDLTKE